MEGIYIFHWKMAFGRRTGALQGDLGLRLKISLGILNSVNTSPSGRTTFPLPICIPSLCYR